MAKLPLNIFLLGDPAAGKATQAAFLVKKYKLIDLDMGKELFKKRQKDKNIDSTLKGSTDRGNLTPTKIVQDIFKNKILSAPKTKGILFDGTPKMLVEAKYVHGILKKIGRSRTIFIYLSIPMTETIKRMTNRTGYFESKFSKRPDDSTAALKNRVAYYRKNVAAVIKFFKAQYPYKKISGLGNRNQVEKRITEFIKKYA